MLYLLTCCGTDADTALLPHFLGHYRNEGIQRFLVILHSKSCEMAQMEKARGILAAFGIIAEEEWGGVYTSERMHTIKLRVLSRITWGAGDWVVHADVDEFHEYKPSLTAVIERARRAGANAVFGKLIDRTSADGRLVVIDVHKPIWEQFPHARRISESRFQVANVRKLCVSVSALRPSRGNHFALEVDRNKCIPAQDEITIHHFKWHAGVVSKLRERIEVYRREGFDWVVESERMLAWIESNGRIPMDDE